MSQQSPRKPKSLFSAVSFACLLIGLLLAYSLSGKLEQGGTIRGYSSLSIMLSFLVALLLSGLVTGQIALIRGEKPALLPILALFLNSVIFIAVILFIPR